MAANPDFSYSSNASRISFSSSEELHAYSLGAGVFKTLRACRLSRQVTSKLSSKQQYIRSPLWRPHSSRKMRPASIGVRNFGNDLSPILHSQEHGFIIHTIRILFDINARFRPDSFCGETRQLVNVKANITLGHLIFLITDKATTRKIEKVIAVMQA